MGTENLSLFEEKVKLSNTSFHFEEGNKPKKNGKAWLESQDETAVWNLFGHFASHQLNKRADKQMADALSVYSHASGYGKIYPSTWQKYRITRTDPKWKAFTSKRKPKEIVNNDMVANANTKTLDMRYFSQYVLTPSKPAEVKHEQEPVCQSFNFTCPCCNKQMRLQIIALIPDGE